MAKKSKGKYGVDAFRYMPYIVGGWAGGVIVLYLLKKMADGGKTENADRQQRQVPINQASSYWTSQMRNQWRKAKEWSSGRSVEPEWMKE